MNPLNLMGVSLIILVLLWIYKCIVKLGEGRHKNVYSFGKWVRTIVGARDSKIVSENGEIGEIPKGEPKNTKRFDFIFWPLERTSSFDFSFTSIKPVSQLIEEEKKHVEWGDLTKDNEVVVSRLERTNHHRDQYDYDMIFKDIETGLPHVPDSVDASKIKSPQNVKVKMRLRVTVKAYNVQDAENRTGGGTLIWFPSLKAIIATGLGDLIGSGSFSDLIKLRGENIDKKKLSSSELPTFLEYVNEQMLKVKKLGYGVLSIDFIDYEIMPESAGYIKALADLADSEVRKEKADNEAYIADKRMEPYVKRAKELIGEYVLAITTIRDKEDKTMVQSTANLKDLRILGSLNTSGSSGQTKEPEMPSIETIMSILAAQIAKEELEKPEKPKK